jgi:hypothetical protein
MAASHAGLLEAACGLSPQFETPPNCTRCAEVFRVEVIVRRVYELKVGLAVAAFCQRCAEALPKGGAADIEFRAHLERQALANVPPQGRA